MWRKPGARPLRFEASEEFSVATVTFVWRARFPVLGPLALEVVDELAESHGRLRVRMLGIPLQTQTGPETALGQAMRYLAELAWAPHAVAVNAALEWRETGERTVEVATSVGRDRATVHWEFDQAGDIVRATGMRPLAVGKDFVATPWGGDFSNYASFAGTRIPASADVWWDLPEGRFVYWRGRVTAVELLGFEHALARRPPEA